MLIDPLRAELLSRMGSAHLLRFGHAAAPGDLSRAIGLFEAAVAATPAGHPRRCGYLANLSNAHLLRFRHFGEPLDMAALRRLTAQIASASTAPLAHRVMAANHLGQLAHAMGEHAVAVELFDAALAMLPLVAGRSDHLGGYADLVGQAVAAHCALGDPAGAAEVAELGRGVLLAAQLGARTELTDLDRVRPTLAARFRDVRDRLTTPGSADEAEQRGRLWREWDELIGRIREVPGFTRFLLPPRLADLRPGHGAVVLVNADHHRGDALVITGDGEPARVSLTGLRAADVRTRARELMAATHDGGTRGVLPGVLGWLWDTVVEPVVAALHHLAAGPRVWWLPVGLLGLFPLHAAGHAGRPGALDRLVSSYTPTLRVLAHARARPAATARRGLTVDRDATVDRVRAELPSATWAHFDCPADLGGLRLHDGPLLLPDISRLADAELAYLSACSPPGPRDTGEALNPASAFQLAGFRHVIASLWPLADAVAASSAAGFYRLLPAGPSADGAATALHEVVLGLRAKHPDRPDVWAALIHSGP